MNKVMVTGATGFVGRHCLPHLAAAGLEVHAVSSRSSPAGGTNVYWHQTDLLDVERANDLMRQVQPTHLLHLAWHSVPGEFWTSTSNLDWVRASLTLLRAFADHGGQRLVVAGSCAEYDWSYGFCSENVTPLSPETLYGICKHSLWMMMREFARQKTLSVAWGRIFHMYGPWEHPDRLVASVIRAFLRGQPALCSHGNQIRDFLYVEDVAEAFVTLLVSNCVGAVNVASGIPVALRDVVHEIGERTGPGHSAQFGALPVPANEPRLLVANVSRLADEVGWHPKYPLGAGLDRTVAWWHERLFSRS